jgi:hypothetical protein
LTHNRHVHAKKKLAALRALHIIPREPTPLPLEERPEEELTPEELLQVVRTFKVDCVNIAILLSY